MSERSGRGVVDRLPGLAYGMAVPGFATAVAEVLPSGNRASTAVYVLGVLLVSLLAGWMAGLVASFVGVLLEAIFFVDPERSLRIAEAGDLVPVGVLLAASLAVVWTVHGVDTARRAAEEAGEGLRRLATAEHTARQDAERIAERVRRLQAITAALADVAASEDVVDVVLTRVVDALGATAGSLVLLSDDGTCLDVVGHVGYPDDVMRGWPEISVDSETPLAESVRHRRPVCLRSVQEVVERYPALGVDLDRTEHKAVAALPLEVEGRVLGAIGLSFEEPPPFDSDHVDYLVAAANQCAQALERARLWEAERLGRTRSDFLADASAVLASSLDYEVTVARVAGLTVPQLADWCVMHVIDAAGVPRPLVAAHVDPSKARRARELYERWPITLDEAGVGATMRTREVLHVPEVTDDMLETVAHDADHLAFLRSMGIGSVMAVPLVSRGRVLGALTLGDEVGRRSTEEDLALAEQLAARAAQAIDNARLFHERTTVARTLQRSLLPPALPPVAGLELASRYVPVGEGLEVGGDFYDAFVGPDRVVLVVGDVQGKGVEAATVTGLARHTLRSVGYEGTPPSVMLTHLNEVLLRTAEETREAGSPVGSPAMLEPRFCTAAVVVLERRGDGFWGSVCCGGHPAPLVLRADGRVETCGRMGTVLGVVETPALSDAEVTLEPGDALVCFTDGVTERREGTRFLDDEGLVAVLRAARGRSADDIAGAIEDAVLTFSDAAPRDDLAVLVAAVPPA